MIRIFVIEDQYTLTVAGLRNLFRPSRSNIEITNFSITVEDAVKNADPETFDLFILDLWIPGSQPIQNIRLLKEKFPGKGIVVYTSEVSSSWKRRMMNEGAMVYITKTANREDIKTALEKAYAGERYITGSFETNEMEEIIVTSNAEGKKISPVQKEIVLMIKEGYKHKEIASRLGLSSSRIEKILSAVRNDYHVKNNYQLISLLTELKEI